MRVAVALAVAASLGATASAGGSIFVVDDVRPALRVDARGTAEISWHGQSVIVPAKGQLTHGGSLAGADVSKPASVRGLTLALVTRRTPDGTLWALQSWQVEPGGPSEVHLARWKGAPTGLALSSDGGRVTGSATFQGKPVTGTTSTLEGKHLRIYVYLDCFACPAAHGARWARMLGVAPKPDGTFAVLIRPEWLAKRYRATVAGPNIGTTFAPDARVVLRS
jgi:hypothetical protein